MSARILPFKRPEPKEAPTIPAPLITGHDESWGAWIGLVGTKEQLLAWGAAEERHFPVKPKRMAYNGSTEPSVRAVKGGLFAIHWHAGRDEIELAQRILALTRRVLVSSNEPCRSTTGLFNAIHAWRRQLVESQIDGYEAGLLGPLDTALDAFETAAGAMVTYRKPPEVVRLPPDETEPEHAQ